MRFENVHFPHGPAWRSKIKFNPIENSISLEVFNPGVSICGALLVYGKGLDRKIQYVIERSKISFPKSPIERFQLEFGQKRRGSFTGGSFGKGVRVPVGVPGGCFRIGFRCGDGW